MDKTPEAVTLYFEILEMVKSEFQVKDSYLRDDIPTFIIVPNPQIREKIDRLRVQLLRQSRDIVLKKINGELVLTVVKLTSERGTPPTFLRQTLPLLLLIATVITVTISGYMSADSYVTLLHVLGRPTPSKLSLTVAYTISVMGVLGLHEMGHTIACRIHHVKASLPLFIPGIPGITPGTFGAVIRQKSPILNRNQLFDVGVIAPLLSFIASLIVSYIGYSWSIPVSEMEYNWITSTMGAGQIVFLPAIFIVLGRYIFPSTNSYTNFLHPVGWAGWILTLIAFLNAFPIGQLDGGHVSRALLGRKWHRRLSYIMIGVMVLVGWWMMAFLALFLAQTSHPGPLDDTTQLSRNRKIIGAFFALTFIACFTFSPQSPLLMLILS